jgi:hypothetical protein
MSPEFAHVSLAPGPPLAGTCDLCATTTPNLIAALIIQHERGGTVQFTACDRCALAVRRLAAATGGRAHLVVAHEVGSVHRPAAAHAEPGASTLAPAAGTTHRSATAHPEHNSNPLAPSAAYRPEPLPQRDSPTAHNSTTPQLIEERAERVRDTEGHTYVVRLYGEPRPDGTWVGWAQFVAVDGTAILRTSPETTQSSRDQIAYWASGLEPLYFEGAFRRAQPAATPA